MNMSSSLRWAGWSVLASALSMIASIVFNIIGVSNGSITPGAHSHSVLVETFDVLTTAFLLPVPFALHQIYRAYAPRLSFWSMLLGTTTFLVVTVLHVLFVFEVLWFSDPSSQLIYAIVCIGLVFWLISVAYLAYKSRKPLHGTLLNIIGATIIGFPVWMFWLGYLLASGKLTDQPA